MTFIVLHPAPSADGPDPIAYGPFESEDSCYRFAATISEEPNDWLPLEVKGKK
jgi:hypothetical protein